MQTQECVRLGSYRDQERNDELIGVLTAISIVSKRLARRLTALEHSRTHTKEGGRAYDTGQSRPVGQ
ncbi:hypothetical protein FACS1894132_05710 [Clostridia bacterium]|nr:hypothetical protein FACS1894132_05710 [Clostridia bacterium]